MHIRLVFALALFFVSTFSGYGVQLAHADYCTVEDILEGYASGVPIGEVVRVCEVLDVEGCDAEDVYYMVGEGFSLSDIYYECR